MASDLSLLFRLKAENQASPVIHQVQADSKKLTQSVSSDFSALAQVSNSTLGKITTSLTNFSGSIPIVGNAVSSLTSDLSSMATVTEGAGAEFAALAGPIGLVVVGTAAMAGAVVKLGEELFTLAKIAGETQGKLFDLSQQTGVSVETLAGLEELAKTTGGSIESIAQSLVVFQGNIEAAQDPTSKQAGLFKNLGVEATNTEEALRQTLEAINKMPEGFRQTNAAAELFGRRGGKQFLAILKESHGDIDQTIRELQGLGLANSENAKRADEFNDELVHLQTQLTAIAVTIGNDVIPVILDVLKDLEKALKDNKEIIDAVRVSAQGLAIAIGAPLKGAIFALNATLESARPALEIYKELLEAIGAAAQLVTNTVPNVGANAIGSIPLGGDTGEEGLKELERLLKAAQGTLNLGPGKPFNLREIFGDAKKTKEAADPAIALLKQLQGEVRNLDNATKAEIVTAELLDKKYKDISPTLREQILLTARLIDQKKEQAEQDEILKGAAEELKQHIDAEKEALENFIEAQRKALEGPRSELDKTEEFIKRFSFEFGNLSGALDENIKFWLRFNAALIDSNRHLETLKEQLKEVADLTPAIPTAAIPKLPKGIVFDDSELGPPPEAEKRFRNLQASIDDLGTSFGNLFDASKDFGIQFGDVIGGAVADLAHGIGDLVEQYVLLGETAPHALRKLLASTLAHVAAEASVKAIFQLAEAFASLAIGDARGAASHFTSAAIFGSIAGVAAVAGRAAAGDLFKPQATGATGSGQSGPIQTITTGRNQQSAQVVHVVEVRVKDSEFGRAVTAHVVKDIGDGGQIREVIQNDGR